MVFDHAAGQAPVHRLRLADGARQALRAAHARHRADRHLRLAELRRVRGDDQVAHHRQLAATAQRVARHRGDDGLAHRAQRLVVLRDVVVAVHLRVAPVGHRADVGAGGERLLAAGDHDDRDAGVVVEGAQRRGQLRGERIVQRVEALRAVERDDRDAVAGVGQDVVVGHAARTRQGREGSKCFASPCQQR